MTEKDNDNDDKSLDKKISSISIMDKPKKVNTDYITPQYMWEQQIHELSTRKKEFKDNLTEDEAEQLNRVSIRNPDGTTTLVDLSDEDSVNLYVNTYKRSVKRLIKVNPDKADLFKKAVDRVTDNIKDLSKGKSISDKPAITLKLLLPMQFTDTSLSIKENVSLIEREIDISSIPEELKVYIPIDLAIKSEIEKSRVIRDNCISLLHCFTQLPIYTSGIHVIASPYPVPYIEDCMNVIKEQMRYLHVIKVIKESELKHKCADIYAKKLMESNKVESFTDFIKRIGLERNPAIETYESLDSQVELIKSDAIAKNKKGITGTHAKELVEIFTKYTGVFTEDADLKEIDSDGRNPTKFFNDLINTRSGNAFDGITRIKDYVRSKGLANLNSDENISIEIKTNILIMLYDTLFEFIRTTERGIIEFCGMLPYVKENIESYLTPKKIPNINEIDSLTTTIIVQRRKLYNYVRREWRRITTKYKFKKNFNINSISNGFKCKVELDEEKRKEIIKSIDLSTETAMPSNEDLIEFINHILYTKDKENGYSAMGVEYMLPVVYE